MVVRLPINKVQEIVSNLNLILYKKCCTLKEMQSLISSLNSASRAIVPCRPFYTRLIDSMTSASFTYK